MARVLVVDDSATIRRTLKLILNKQHKTLTAVNGKDALDKLKKHIFDVLVLDIDMPVMGGYELLFHLRSDSRLCQMPVIMLTQSGDPADKIQAHKYGVTCYLSKPVFSGDLLDHVNRLVPDNNDVTKPLPPLPPIDRAALIAMGHDAATIDKFLADVLPVFKQELNPAMQSLRQAIDAGHTLEVGRISYKLRNRCSSLGVSRLEQLCFEMGMAARQEIKDGMLMKLIEMKAEIERIDMYTEKYFS